MTWNEYGQNLEARLADLHGRVHRGAYRAKPSRRVNIPKPDDRQRPLGIAAHAAAPRLGAAHAAAIALTSAAAIRARPRSRLCRQIESLGFAVEIRPATAEVSI